jgi:8-oxoguanine deaminase
MVRTAATSRIALRRIGHLYPGPADAPPIADAVLLLTANRIVHLGREADGLPADWTANRTPVREIDCAGCVVTPGLVNTHHHFFQHLTRAIPAAMAASPLDWLFVSDPLWAELDPAMLYAAARAASAELLLSGCTTAADCAYLLPQDDGELATALTQVVVETGIRFHFHRGCMPTLEGDLEERLKLVMGPRVQHLMDYDETALIRRLEAAIGRHHDDSALSMCRVALGPTGVTYTRPALMTRLAEMAHASGCGLHTHFHPRPDEDAKAAPDAPIEFLERSGWLRPGTWLAHGTRLSPSAVAMLARTGTGVAHCPRTIVRLGFSIARIGSFRRAGLRLGLGVDGAGSNDQGNLLSALRLATLLHRVAEPPDLWLTPEAALEMATVGGASALDRTDIGCLAPGMAADVAAFRIDGLDCAGAVADPLGALLVAGTETRAWLTIVNGVVRVEQRKLVDLDESAIAAELNAAAARMLAQAKRATGIDFSQKGLQLPS